MYLAIVLHCLPVCTTGLRYCVSQLAVRVYLRCSCVSLLISLLGELCMQSDWCSARRYAVVPTRLTFMTLQCTVRIVCKGTDTPKDRCSMRDCPYATTTVCRIAYMSQPYSVELLIGQPLQRTKDGKRSCTACHSA